MDNDFSEKLKNVLSDPTALAKIASIAQSMGLSTENVAAEESKNEIPQPKAETALAQTVLPAISSDPRVLLLENLKPLIKEEKRPRIDSIERALTVMSLMKTLRK